MRTHKKESSIEANESAVSYIDADPVNVMRPEGLPEDIPYVGIVNDPTEEMDPFVYNGNMTPEEYENTSEAQWDAHRKTIKSAKKSFDESVDQCKSQLQSQKAKYICMFLAALCLVVALVLALTSWAGWINKKGSGDVNQDGILSQADIDLAADFVVCRKCPTIKQLQAADVNGDGRLTSSDLTLMCRAMKADKE